MSATLTCFPVHTGAHMYRHYEMEPQQLYPNDGYNPYLVYSEFPANADHTENFHDEVQYSGLPSPQLVCPRPSLPPSQFPNQFSWSSWPSEAPMNVYQAYEPSSNHRHTSSIPHSLHATDVQSSFENQQALAPGFYPAQQEFVETGPNRISSPFHQGDSGYTQQVYLTSTASFQLDQSNDLTTSQPRYYTAHQDIPPEKCSSYSELAPNLSFMNNQAQVAQPPLIRRETIHTQGHHTPKGVSDDVTPRTTSSATSSLDMKKNSYALGLLNGPPLTSIGRKKQPPVPAPSNYIATNNSTIPATTTKTKSSRSVHESRRSSLACTFACGRPPDGNADPTCKQCARRTFRCRYLDVKSTQLVRSRASSKDLSSPLSLKRRGEVY